MKIAFIIFGIIVLIFLILFFYCACIVASDCSRDEEQMEELILERKIKMKKLKEKIEEYNELLKNKELNEENVKVQYVLLNEDDTIYETICYGSFEMYRIDPNTNEITQIPDWAYTGVDNEIFEPLINGKKIGYMTMESHYNIWNEIDELYPDDIYNKDGLEFYLDYCKENNITKDIIDEELNSDVPNIVKYYEQEMER